MPAWGLAQKIVTEGVNIYQTCGGSNLFNSISNNTNFRNAMITGSGYWLAGFNYTNSSVWAADLYDPQRVTGGIDTFNSLHQLW